MNKREFHQLVRPGVLVQWRDANSGALLRAPVVSTHWKSAEPSIVVELPGYALLRPTSRRLLAKVEAWQVTDVPPDRSDIDSVEEWLERGTFINPYDKPYPPTSGPLCNFWVDKDGKVQVRAEPERGPRMRGMRSIHHVVDEAPAWNGVNLDLDIGR